MTPSQGEENKTVPIDTADAQTNSHTSKEIWTINP